MGCPPIQIAFANFDNADGLDKLARKTCHLLAIASSQFLILHEVEIKSETGTGVYYQRLGRFGCVSGADPKCKIKFSRTEVMFI